MCMKSVAIVATIPTSYHHCWCICQLQEELLMLWGAIFIITPSQGVGLQTPTVVFGNWATVSATKNCPSRSTFSIIPQSTAHGSVNIHVIVLLLVYVLVLSFDLLRLLFSFYLVETHCGQTWVGAVNPIYNINSMGRACSSSSTASQRWRWLRHLAAVWWQRAMMHLSAVSATLQCNNHSLIIASEVMILALSH